MKRKTITDRMTSRLASALRKKIDINYPWLTRVIARLIVKGIRVCERFKISWRERVRRKDFYINTPCDCVIGPHLDTYVDRSEQIGAIATMEKYMYSQECGFMAGHRFTSSSLDVEGRQLTNAWKVAARVIGKSEVSARRLKRPA